MHIVSYPATSVAARWRPDGAVGTALSGTWVPAQRPSWAKGRQAALASRMGQAPAKEGVGEAIISVSAAFAALVAGATLALHPSRSTTTMWVGILAATVGGLRLLQIGSKLA